MGLKKQGLTGYFIKHIIQFSIVILLWGVFLIASFMIMLNEGPILPANYVENQLHEMQAKKADKAEVMSIIPFTKGYAVYNSEGDYMEGNVSHEQAQRWWHQIIDEENSFRKQMFVWDNEICIISYNLATQYANQLLNRYLPDPGIIFILLLIGGFIADIVWISWSLKRKLVNEFKNIEEITHKIEDQNLDFEIYDSRITEIGDLLDSIQGMRVALMKSLESQWNQAHELKEQVASLAHDIKTPLTVIRGNVDLLKETEEDGFNQELLNYIDTGASQLENYTDLLVEINISGKGYELNLSNYKVADLIMDIEREKNALMSVKHIEISLENVSDVKEIKCDSMFLMRAISNVISNAGDFAQRYVHIKVDDDGEYFHIHVIDDGPGFSEEDIKKSKKQFYMGDSSRNGNKHFGLGLYSANAILEQHRGSIVVKNDVESGGGHVEVLVPCK